MNDEKMPAYVTSNLTLGYRMKSFSYLKHPQIQLNLTNIGDNHYPVSYTHLTLPTICSV